MGSEDDGDLVSETCYEDEEPVHRFVDQMPLKLALFQAETLALRKLGQEPKLTVQKLFGPRLPHCSALTGPKGLP